MRLTNKIVMGLMVLALAFTAESCGKKKKATEVKPKGEELVTLYCSGAEYISDRKTFRATAIGESLDQMTSKKKALSNAKAELASMISTTIKGTIDNYVNSREFNNTEEVEERFESLTREVINQELRGAVTACEKMTKTTEGKYKTYLCMELSGEKLAKQLNERISQDDRLKIDYDYEKFKKTFEKEMEKLEHL